MSTRARTSPEAPAPVSTRSAPVPIAAQPGHTRDPLLDGLESPAQSLDTDVRATMERRFGHNFSDIRVHAGSAAAESARALGADAYSAGRDLVFAAGRYDPPSCEGRHLIAHELAHAAHSRTANERRAGIAPGDSPAERKAERAADHAMAVGRPAPTPYQFVRWGPAWTVHRQVTKTKTKGKVAHTGEVGRLPGETGVPYGAVEVRTGEEIEFKSGGTIPNVIALEYSGLLSADMKWLQFVWFELTANTPAGVTPVTGTIPTSSGTKPFTTDPKNPTWSVDSASTADPFYEAAAAHLRTKSAATVFDAPGGGSATPLADAVFNAGVRATSVTFTAHFETYLVRGTGAVYVVAWQAATAFTQTGGKTVPAAIGYTVGASGPVAGLPGDRHKLLAASYPTFKTIK